MNALVSVIESVGIFLAGLVVRFGILVAVLVVLAAVFLAGYGVVRLAAMLRRRVLGLGTADDLTWKRSGYYASGHTWVESAGAKKLKIGFDDLAQKVLGHVTAITLATPGTELAEGQPLAEVRAGKRRAIIPSPVRGKVVAINRAVVSQPALVHRDPYRRGWLLAVEPADTAYTRLRWGQAATGWLREESARLRRSVEHELQLHAADGGELTGPVPSLLSDAQWSALVRSFLAVEHTIVE